MRVFIYFTYEEYHSIRKWMQRHPEYDGSLFSNDGFYIAKFDIDATDPQAVAYFFNYFSHKEVEIFKMKKIDPYKVLKNFKIISFKPFIARAKSQDLGQNPGNDAEASDDLLENVRPDETYHDEPSPSQLFSSGAASRDPQEAEKASSIFSGSGGDQYDYWPEGGEYE